MIIGVYKLTYSNEQSIAVYNLNFLLKNATRSIDYFKFSAANELHVNSMFKAYKRYDLKHYLQDLIDEVSEALYNPEENKISPFLILLVQKFIHINPNNYLKELSLSIPSNLNRLPLEFKKIDIHSDDNTLSNRTDRTLISFDSTTKTYTAPDDEHAHNHGKEAKNIFFATQTERFKSLINRLFTFFNIHIFETASYQEHQYLHTDIYANDLAINPFNTTEVSHFLNGHATNFFSIPTGSNTSLSILTDPVEGHLHPLLYPRMTTPANKINNTDQTMLPKVDMVVISHNHRDHVDIATLKRLVNQQPLMVIPEGDLKLFKNLGFNNIVELKWWEQTTITLNNEEVIRITAVPSRHWSGRGLLDAHKSAFNGYVFQPTAVDSDIYFAGDTALIADEISAPIYEAFDIKLSLQPGGPDEFRKDMESTHQCSADGVLVHFKMLLALYKKQIHINNNLTLDEFLHEANKSKTIFNHTSTFKLGNLRLRDTFYSINRLKTAFEESEQWRLEHLTPYELEVFTDITLIQQQISFNDGSQLNDDNIVSIIDNSVVIPKIGQRTTFSSTFPQGFDYRNLILNKRSLIESDLLAKQWLKTHNDSSMNVTSFLIQALEAYINPWHASLTRTSTKVVLPYLEQLKTGNEIDLFAFIQTMEKELAPLNRAGHLQSIINYSKWLLSFDEKNSSLELANFFFCQDMKKHMDGDKPGFIDLANQLARAPTDNESYTQVINEWNTGECPYVFREMPVFFNYRPSQPTSTSSQERLSISSNPS